MNSLLKSYKLWLVLIVLFIATLLLLFNGINFGIEFAGGTLFQIHFSEKIKSTTEMEKVSSIIEQRLNWTGLKDVKVYSVANEFVIAQLPETDPAKVQQIESLLKKQGKFEVMIDGKIAFVGEDVIQVDQETSMPAVQQSSAAYRWNLPFVLKNSAAKNFRDLSFHKCSMIGYGNDSEENYDCENTYFFIDRPNAVILITEDQYLLDRDLFMGGNSLKGMPSNLSVDEVISNSALPLIQITKEGLPADDLSALKEYLKQHSEVVLQTGISLDIKEKLKSLGFKVREIKGEENLPWLWTALGIKSVVRLQPSVTGDEPYVESVEQAKVITDLIIKGTSQTQEEAFNERGYTKILLESGSLPVAVESINKETISPLLGENFIFSAGIIGLLVIISVALVLFFRYRALKLSLAILAMSISEAYLALVFTSQFGSITLAAIAGVLAAVGTGVNDQIVITDELTSSESKESLSLMRKIKNAFFIVFAAAATSLSTMLPVIIFGSAMISLMGFAIATVIGVVAGIFITRPFYAEFAKYMLENKKD